MSDDLVGIVGESFRQDALMRLLAAHPDRACLVKLIAEPDNPADPNAIKVVSADDDAMLGYISRAEAAGFHAAVDALGANTHYRAKLWGGTDDKPSVGLWFDAGPLRQWRTQQCRAQARERRAVRKDARELKDLRRQLRAVTRERDKARRELAKADPAHHASMAAPPDTERAVESDEHPSRLDVFASEPAASSLHPDAAIEATPQPAASQVADTAVATPPHASFPILRVAIIAAALIVLALLALIN
jgi:hypothetical protein